MLTRKSTFEGFPNGVWCIYGQIWLMFIHENVDGYKAYEKAIKGGVIESYSKRSAF